MIEKILSVKDEVGLHGKRWEEHDRNFKFGYC